MNYLIYSQDLLDKQLAELLAKEIARFDIRAEITQSGKRQEAESHLKNKPCDLVIEIGAKENAFLKNIARKKGLKRCFLYQSLKDSGSRRLPSTVVLVFGDKPGLPSSMVYEGNAVFDVVKSCAATFEGESNTNAQVAVVSGFGSRKVMPRVDMLSKLLPDVNFVYADLEQQFEASVQQIQSSNAAIVSSNMSELISLYLNCPLVRVNGRKFFQKDQFSVLNELSQKETAVVLYKSQSNLISKEVQRLLNDHHYCAGVLQDYQAIKDLMGVDPATRKIARHMVEWMEEA